MNFLPIVERELRVAARKRSTFWLRVAAAVTALVIGCACFLLNTLQRIPPAQLGSMLFYALTWLCLAAVLCAGLFFTSDCLSEEKREGTLGLLFLTDLRGFDVALGKLVATSLRGFYALLAILPILAITLLMGAITGAQYWRSTLALTNALFVSLAAGLAVSAMSRNSQKAMSATLGLLLLLALGGPITDGIIASVKNRIPAPFWSLASPGYVLASSGSGGSTYWNALGLTHLFGWGLLILACLLVPHTWQEKKRAGSGAMTYAWKYGGARRRQAYRRKLFGRQPVMWLVCRERWQSLGLWLLTILATGGFVAGLWHTGRLLTLLLYLWAASQACMFFVEARRSGLLELLLAAPVNERQIVKGQWQALLRMFGLPVALLLSLQVAAATLSRGGFGIFSMMFDVGMGQNLFMSAAAATASAVTTAANLLALCWFGMWMGMTSRSANLATLKTILFVQLIPWLVLSFGTSFGLGVLMFATRMGPASGQSSSWVSWFPILSTGLLVALTLAKDTAFILWSRRKLHSSLREQATRSFETRTLKSQK